MDVKFINPFIAAIKNVFSTMAQVEVSVGKPQLHSDRTTPADVSGVIGLSGDVTGAVVLSFPAKVATRLASKFAGVEMETDHPDFGDAVGELTNMVAGNAKKDLTGLSVSISLPSVIVGAQHEVSQLKACPQLVIPCQTPLGPFNVEVSMLVEKESQARAEPAAVGA